MRVHACQSLAWATFVTVLLWTPAALGQHVFHGQVLGASDGAPIEGAQVTLDLDEDGQPEAQTQSNVLGLYEILWPDELTDQTAALRAVHPRHRPQAHTLTPNTDNTRQDFVLETLPNNQGEVALDVEIHCVISNSTLPDTTLTLLRWDNPQGDGAPTDTSEHTTGALGRLRIEGIPAGFYRLELRRTGWLPLSWPPEGTAELNQDQTAIIGLEPEDATLNLTVRGSLPTQQAEPDVDQPIEGAVVEIIGVDLSTGEDTTPAQMLRTDASGNVSFGNLPAVPHRVQIKKMGYQPQHTLITPDPNGAFPSASVSIRTHPDTALQLNVTASDFPRDVPFGAGFFVYGIEGTHTEGIERRINTQDFTHRDNTNQALIHNLLPGQYRVVLRHDLRYARDYTGDVGPLQNPPRLFYRYQPLQAVVEIAHAQRTTVPLHLEPVPTTLSGTLWAHEGFSPAQNRHTAPQPIHNTVANQTIELIPDPQLQRVLGVERLQTQTDDQGRYTIDILPGYYGLRVPRAGFTTGTIQARSEGGLVCVSSGDDRWPYGIWPHTDYNPNSVARGPLALTNQCRSGLDIHIRRAALNVVFGIREDNNGAFRGAFFPEQSPTTLSLFDFSPAEITAEGPNTPTHTRTQKTTVEFYGLNAGTWTFTAQPHPHYSFATQELDDNTHTLDIAPFPLPGDPPAAVPDDRSNPPNTEQVHFITQWTTELLEPLAERVTVFRISRQDWNGNGYSPVPGAFGGWFERDIAPGVFTPFSVASLLPLDAGYAYFPCTDNTWYKTRITGNAFSYRCGGPQSDASPDNAPTQLSALNLNVSVRTSPLFRLNGDQPLPDIPITITPTTGDPLTATHGQTLTTTHWPELLDVQPPTGWILDDAQTRLDILTPTLTATLACHLRRGTGISGQVVDESTGEPLSGANITAFNRAGQIIGAHVSGPDGNFALTLPTTPEVWLQTEARGFIPQRIHARFPQENPDLTGLRTEARPLPAPDLTNFEVDRFGVFLPGVLKSGDSRGFNADNAKGSLTATLSARAEITTPATAELATIGQPGATQTVTLEDTIAEVHFIDPRIYTAGFNDADPTALQWPQSISHPTWEAFVQAATEGQNDDGAFNVRTFRAQRDNNGTWRAPVELWTMTPGTFAPLAVAITQRGAVGVVPYARPLDREPLRGARFAPWMGDMLNIIGSLANADVGLSVAEQLPLGPLRVSESFEGGIVLDEQGYLDYQYWVGVTFQEGQPAPNKGLIGLAGGHVGLSATGRVEFLSMGRTGEVTVSGRGALTTTRDLVETGAATPGLARRVSRGLVTFIKPAVSVEASLGVAQRIGGDGDAARFRLQREVGGSVRTGVRVNLEPFFALIPGIGPALSRLKALGVECTLRFLIELGGTFRSNMVTGYVQNEETPQGAAMIGSFLGPDQGVRQPPQSFTFKSSIALEFQTPGNLLRASGGIQLGPPEGRPAPGLEVTFATDSDAPYVRRVRGAVSATASVGFSIAGRSLSRRFQFDVLGIDWQSGTDPFVTLTPNQETTTVLTPMTAPAPSWVDDAGVLVERFYPAAHWDTNAKDALAFIQTDPDTGAMDIMVSLPQTESKAGRQPVRVANTEGAAEVAIAELDDGRQMVAWLGFGAADLGNPYAQMSVFYTISDDPSGQSWQPPTLITQLDGYGVHLLLSTSANSAALVWMVSENALSTQRDVHAALWDGEDFGAVQTITERASVLNAALEGLQDPEKSDFALVLQHQGGLLQAHQLTPDTISAPTELANDSAAGLAMTANNQGGVHLVYDTANGDLALLSRTAQSPWAAPQVAIEGEGARDLTALSWPSDVPDAEAGGILLAWTVSNGGDDLLRYATLSPEGLPIDGPHTIEDELQGNLFKPQLSLWSREPLAAALRVIHPSANQDRLVEYILLPGQDPIAPAPPEDQPTPPAHPDADPDARDSPDAQDNTDAAQNPDADPSPQPPGTNPGDDGCACQTLPPQSPGSPLWPPVLLLLAVVWHRTRSARAGRKKI